MSEEDNQLQLAMLMSMFPDIPPAQAQKLLSKSNGSAEEAARILRSTKQPPGVSAKKSVPPPVQYFVGGGTSSGQAVVAPPVKKKPSPPPPVVAVGDAVKELFEKAKDSAMSEESNTAQPSPLAFTGTGRRLGHLEGPSPIMQPVRRSEKKFRLTFWKNGFQVDDGPLRDPNTPENSKFIQLLHKGFVPPDIAKDYPNTDFSVELADRADQDYVPPKYTAFGGSGRTLEVHNTPPAPTSKPSLPMAPQQLPTNYRADDFFFNSALESCKVVLQSFDGTRQEVLVNPKVHTILQLKAISRSMVAVLHKGEVELVVREMPPRPLKETGLTVEEAKCKNCVILIRKV